MVSTISLAREKAPSVKNQIEILDVGEKARTLITKRSYMNSLVSGLLKAQYPERTYKLSKDKENARFLIIERLK